MSSRSLKKGVGSYDERADDAFEDLANKDYLSLTDVEKLLAALALVRDVSHAVHVGSHRCDSCTRQTYEDWKGHQIKQVYKGLVSKLRNAISTTETALGEGWKPRRPDWYYDDRQGSEGEE
jgi:hypothetical protein